jgi:RNA polymerase sigma-70 factor (ECF subfamily)
MELLLNRPQRGQQIVGGGETPPRVSPRTAEQVFHEYAGRVYNLARRMLASDADAEDVTQDVLLQVVRKLSTFRGQAEFSTWLHRVAVNAALLHRRKHYSRPERHLEDSLDQLPCPRSGKGQKGPASQALNREAQALIEGAIGRLPEKYRDVYVLADVEGLPNAEIAQMLSLSLAAVKSRLHRARLMLRDSLAPHFPEGLL